MKWTPDLVMQKFDWMYERIQIAEAGSLASPLYHAAIQKLEAQIPSQRQ